MMAKDTAKEDIVIRDKKGNPVFTKDKNDKTAIDMSDLDLKQVDVQGLDLKGANLKRSDISASNLTSTDITGANLSKTKASGSDFNKAACRDVIFFDAALVSCDFTDADLRNANFGRANLTNSDMTGSQTDGTEFLFANLTGVTGLVSIIPDGDITGWKKLVGGKIAKLMIPKDARRINPLGSRICRAEYAVVLDIEGKSTSGISTYDPKFIYAEGETVIPDKFDDDVRDKSSHGINFFLTREEAVNF